MNLISLLVREYIRNTIVENYIDPHKPNYLFIYTDYHDMDYDRYIGITEIDVDD